MCSRGRKFQCCEKTVPPGYDEKGAVSCMCEADDDYLQKNVRKDEASTGVVKVTGIVREVSCHPF